MPPSTGARLVYAVGDVHGRLDVLKPLLHDIAQDALATRPDHRPVLVFLGDYVDRGPDSRQVVDLVLKLQLDGAFDVVALKGNHEEALLQFLAEPAFAMTWMEHGGAATLASYGVQPCAMRTDADAWGAVRDAFDQALPDDHRRFYGELQLFHVVGDYAFVHAGVRPGVALKAQTTHDLLWIRYEFLNDRGPHDKVIVHGHTPAEQPQMLGHRLGLDTGAYATGVLTAVRLYGVEQRLMQARVRLRAA
ncbi:MAG TPA: metallophosphoesterase family protein [Phenylobacterium sp.]|uniref:metallophosphoesterase family protein n=1 Tax=Phenylobacterium sp. TaxID=1871053 RepID=UPI002B48895B|nr:metallophosphoesterase family protein [Phenylobacterium sp.]HKR89996.1 metallophosphoesterase family protein [Phenylobacterium sp.]